MDRTMRELQRQIMKQALTGMANSGGGFADRERERIHQAGMRKARLAQLQQREETSDMGNREKEVRPAQKRQLVRCSAFVGMCVASVLSRRYEEYRIDESAIGPALKRLWADVVKMDEAAKSQCMQALKSTLGKSMNTLGDVFKDLGIDVSATSEESEEL